MPTPTNCDDGNPCTEDRCDPFASCLHQPICKDAGADAAPDAKPDATVDATPDGPNDSSPLDLPADQVPPDLRMTDLAGTMSDSASKEVAADAPVADATSRPEMGAILTDAGSSEPGPAGAATVDDASTIDGPGSGSGDAGSGAGVGGGTLIGDAGAARDAVGSDLATQKLTSGGCSCRLNASSFHEESALAWIGAAGLVMALIRRRRRPR
jgi:hypothetical protein